MSELTLSAEVRTVLGKKVGQLRRNGLIPGVVYGPVVEETVQVSVDEREFARFFKAHGHSTLFTLTWDGGQQPVFIREGGSIPVVGLLKTQLGVDTLLLGWGQNDDNLHGPNEKFSLADFHRGIKAAAHLLGELGA